MKKPLISILLSLLCLLFIFVACTPLESGNNTETTAAGWNETTIDPSDLTAEVEMTTVEPIITDPEESTIEEETTKEETTAEETEPIPSSVKESIKFQWSYGDAVFFDYKLTHLPSNEDFDKIEKGMLFHEILEIVGRPHSMWGSGVYEPAWITSDGYQYVLYIGHPADEFGNKKSKYDFTNIFDFFHDQVLYHIGRGKLNQIPDYSDTNPAALLMEDPRLKVLPSYEDLINLPMGMTFAEVVELYGNPQYYGYVTYGGTTRALFVFYTAEGIEVGIQFYSAENPSLPWDDTPVNYIISLDPQVYYPEFESPETTTATP